MLLHLFSNTAINLKFAGIFYNPAITIIQAVRLFSAAYRIQQSFGKIYVFPLPASPIFPLM